jgi:hypothetical protein
MGPFSVIDTTMVVIAIAVITITIRYLFMARKFEKRFLEPQVLEEGSTLQINGVNWHVSQELPYPNPEDDTLTLRLESGDRRAKLVFCEESN